jgi:hypothetical protein
VTPGERPRGGPLVCELCSSWGRTLAQDAAKQAGKYSVKQRRKQRREQRTKVQHRNSPFAETTAHRCCQAQATYLDIAFISRAVVSRVDCSSNDFGGGKPTDEPLAPGASGYPNRPPARSSQVYATRLPLTRTREATFFGESGGRSSGYGLASGSRRGKPVPAPPSDLMKGPPES